MALLFAYMGVAGLVAFAVFATFELMISERRLSNQQAAWIHRERLAELAYKATEPGTPCLVRKTINYLADRAFDEEFAKFLLRMPKPDSQDGIIEKVRTEHGCVYATMVAEAITAMAFVVALTTGAYRAKAASDPEKMHEVRESKVRPIRVSLTEHLDREPEVHELVAA